VSVFAAVAPPRLNLATFVVSETFPKTEVESEKILFVKVSVVALPAKVSVEVGRVRVPVFDIVAITGVVSVLFVRV